MLQIYQLKNRQITTTTAAPTPNNTTSNISSLAVTVIAAKLPITNLTQLLSTVEATRSLAMATSSGANPMDAATGQIGSNAAIQGNAFQILSLLKNIQNETGHAILSMIYKNNTVVTTMYIIVFRKNSVIFT